jgi:hypothetical protein
MSTGMTAQIIEAPAPVATDTDEGEHDRFSHYVSKPDGSCHEQD